MSWVSDAWAWYVANTSTVNPVVGFIGGGALVWAAVRQARTATNRHYEQTRADQQRRLTESFSKAVEQLSSDKIEVRLGGIYTLERLAIEAIAQVRSHLWWQRLWYRNRPPPVDPVSDLYWTVMETLTAFVRERAKWQEEPAAEAASSELWQSNLRSDTPLRARPPTDIAAVLEVIGRRPEAGRAREAQRDWWLDLSETDLRGARLDEMHLEGASLWGACLDHASLLGTHLERACLNYAHLKNTTVWATNFESADFDGTHLEGASVLLGTNFKGAPLSQAFLDGVSLKETYGDGLTFLPQDIERPAHRLPEELDEPEEIVPRWRATWWRVAKYCRRLPGAALLGFRQSRRAAWLSREE